MKVIFHNNGEIDHRAFSSFGINVKENNNPIGFFGTGLKYAVAILLRNNCKITVYSGLDKIIFSTKSNDFRGKSFDFVYMTVNDNDPIELGFTTELGKNWEMWGAYREIACNCIDESGTVRPSNFYPDPTRRETFIIIEGKAFYEEYLNRDKIILQSSPIYSARTVEFHPGTSTVLYYRGVRVVNTDPSLFTYNILAGVTLTEDRTLKEPTYARYEISKAILSQVTDEKIIEKILLAHKDTYEVMCDFHGWTGVPVSDAFMNVMKKLVADKLTNINPTAIRVYKERTNTPINPTKITLSKVQLGAFKKSVDFCNFLGYDVEKYDINFVESLGDGCLGMAADGEIFISERVLHQGVKQLTATLIEEYIHLKHGYKDNTYEMQTYLFDKIVSLGEELRGESL